MRLDYTTSSLVILGGWNPNVFTQLHQMFTLDAKKISGY